MELLVILFLLKLHARISILRSITVSSGSYSTVTGKTMLRSPRFTDTANHRAIMITTCS